MKKGYSVNHGRARLQKAFFSLVFLMCLLVAVSASAAQISERWVHRETVVSNMGDISVLPGSNPFSGYYIMSDGTAYSTGGVMYTVSQSNSTVYLTNAGTTSSTAYSLSEDGNTVQYEASWVGGSQTMFYDRTSASSFDASVTCTADAFYTREEIIFTAGASGGTAPYTFEYRVFQKGTSGYDQVYSQDTNMAISQFFENAGEYYIFVTAIDANQNRSDCAVQHFTLEQGPETTAVVDSFSARNTCTVIGEAIEWTITASGGEGQLIHDAFTTRTTCAMHASEART